MVLARRRPPRPGSDRIRAPIAAGAFSSDNRHVVLGVLLAVAIVTGVAPAQADCGPTPYDCAVAQVQRQDFPAAITTLTQILTQSPSNLKALNLMGIALTGAGRAADANQRFKQALT